MSFKIGKNQFYKKKVFDDLIQIQTQYADLPASTENSIKLANDISSNNILASVTLPNTPEYGNSKLKGALMSLYSNDIDATNHREAGDLRVYRGRKDVEVSEGGFSFAKRGTTTVGNTMSVYVSRPNNLYYLKNETFDGTDVDLGTVQRVGGNTMVTYHDPYLTYDDLLTIINTRDGANYADSTWTYSNQAERLAKPEDEQGTYSKFYDDKMKVYFSGEGVNQGFYFKRSYGTHHTEKGIAGHIGPNSTWPMEAYGKYIKYNRAETAPIDLDSAPTASEGNTIFDEIILSRDTTNPYDSTTTNPIVISAAELSTEKSTTNGQALRLYHDWAYSDDNPKVQNQLSASGNLNPQVARASIYNIPFPTLPFDIAQNTLDNTSTTKVYGQNRGVVPEIKMAMNISKLEPTIEVNLSGAATLGGDNQLPYLFYNEAAIAQKVDLTNNGNVTFLRSVTVTFANYKPLDTHRTVDEYIAYGLERFYDQETTANCVGGVTFFRTGIDGVNPLNNSTGAMYATPIPVTRVKSYASGTADSANTIGEASGLARVNGSGLLANANFLTLGNFNNGPSYTQMPQTLQMPMNSWFNMRMFMESSFPNNTGSTLQNPYLNASHAFATTGSRGSCMRIFFDRGNSAESTEYTNLPYLDIPFPAHEVAGKRPSGVGESWTWRDNPELFPKHMTIWVQNYPWVSTADTSHGANLYLKGDNEILASGANRETEVFIDNIKICNFTPDVTNVTADNYGGKFAIKPSSYRSPISVGVSGANYVKRWQSSSSSLLPSFVAGRGQMYPYDTGQYVCLGFDNISDFATSGSDYKSGYVLFNDFNTSNWSRMSSNPVSSSFFKNAGLGDPSTPTNAGAMISRDVIKANDGSTNVTVPLGGQMASSMGTYVTGSNTNYSVVSGSNYIVSENATPANNLNKIVLGSGSNTFRSFDAFRQKGFMFINISGATTHDVWARRENVLVCTKVTTLSPASDELNAVMGYSIKVQDPSIFNYNNSNERYRLFLMGADAGDNSKFRSNLTLDTRYKNSEGIITFNEVMTADDGTTQMLTEDNLSRLWVGPEKYWITMLLDSPNTTVPRNYANLCMVEETPNKDTAAQEGSTLNEYTYNYDFTEVANGGSSGKYLNTWDLGLTAESRFIILNEDNGFGAFDDNTKQGGEIARQKLLYNKYSYFDVDSLADKKDISPGDTFPLYMIYDGGHTVEYQSIVTDNESTNPERRPTMYWQYEDLPPVITNLSVEPAVDLLDDNADLYNITSQNLNAIRFKWQEKDADDVWYRLLITADDEAINDKYHNAQMWLPMNEAPETFEAIPSYTVYAPYVGTSGGANEGSLVRGVVEGQGGYGAKLSMAAASGKVTVSNGTNTNLCGLDAFTLVTHWTPSSDDAGVYAYVATATNSVGTAADNFELFKDNNNKIVWKMGTGINITGNKFITCDGEKPVSVICVFDSGSASPTKAKLYIDGILAGTSTGTTNVASGRDFVVGGVYSATATYRGSTGIFEEFVIYRDAYVVVEKANEYLYSTVDTLDIVSSKDVLHGARLFVSDYHNFRGKNPSEIGMSNQTTWEATTI